MCSTNGRTHYGQCGYKPIVTILLRTWDEDTDTDYLFNRAKPQVAIHRATSQDPTCRSLNIAR